MRVKIERRTESRATAFQARFFPLRENRPTTLACAVGPELSNFAGSLRWSGDDGAHLALGDAVITQARQDVMKHWEAYDGISHYWTDTLNSSLSFAYAELDNSAFQSGDAINRAGSSHINLVSL